MPTFNAVQPVQLVPIPDPKNVVKFTSSTLDVTTKINDNRYNFDHTGRYIVSSSSYAGPTTAPWNAFNPSSNSFWMTDFANNPNFDSKKFAYKAPYVNNPYSYSVDGPSAYQSNGGGTIQTNFSTLVGTDTKQTTIFGEWLQIQIPPEFPVYLFKYSILTPSPAPGSNTITFPKKFIIVGSVDGTVWNYVDQRNIKNPGAYDTTDRAPRVFNINSINRYTYFRLIVSEMFEKNSTLSINQWALYGMAEQVKNNDAFTTMSGSNIQYNTLLPNEKYSNYSLSNPVDSEHDAEDHRCEFCKSCKNKKKYFADDSSIYIASALTILATTLIIYNYAKK